MIAMTIPMPDNDLSSDGLWRTKALVPVLERFISDKVGQQAAIVDMERYTMGLSWVTMRIQVRLAASRGRLAGELDLILRVGDPNGLLAPYTARPEFEVLKALGTVESLPIPRAWWFSDDVRIIGAPFLITGRVAGTALSPPWGNEVTLDRTPETVQTERDLADALATIHDFDWRAAGLNRLNPETTPHNAILSEIDRWSARLRKPGQPTTPALRLAERWLRANIPSSIDLRLVHGDYRVGNFLVDAGRVSAILDWELVHLGDPLEDLSWLGLRLFGGTENLIGGMFDRKAFFARYCERRGVDIDVDALRFYDVFSFYKCAIVVESARQRTRTGYVHDARVVSSGLQVASTLMGLLTLLKAPA